MNYFLVGVKSIESNKFDLFKLLINNLKMAYIKTTIMCLCGRKINLEVVGGQYQDTFFGKCLCGRIWSLGEKSEELIE